MDFVKIPKHRHRLKETKRWNDEDTYLLLEYISCYGRDKFEKPNQRLYYEKLMESAETLRSYTWENARDKMKNLKNKYKEALEWKNSTVAALLAENDEKTVEEYLIQKFRFFFEMDKIFGQMGECALPVIMVRGHSTVEKDTVKPLSIFMEEDDELMDSSTSEVLGLGTLPTSPASTTSTSTEDISANCSINKMKHKVTRNPEEKIARLNYLAQMHESNSKYLGKKLKLEEESKEKEFEIKKLSLQLEQERLKLEHQRMLEELRIRNMEIEKNYELQLQTEKMKYEMELEKEKMKHELELKKLQLQLQFKSESDSQNDD